MLVGVWTIFVVFVYQLFVNVLRFPGAYPAFQPAWVSAWWGGGLATHLTPQPYVPACIHLTYSITQQPNTSVVYVVLFENVCW